MKKHHTLYIILALLAFFTLPVFSAGAAQTGGTVILSVEAFTVGYGFIKQPAKVTYDAGDTLFSLIEKSLGKENINYNEDYGRELISVAAKSVWIDVIDEIEEELKEREILYTDRVAETDWLSQYDFTSSSGWFVTVNNSAVKTPLDETVPIDGSVVRVQFSVFGNGADINQPAGAFGTEEGTTAAAPIFPTVNRDEVYRNMLDYMEGSVLDVSESIMEIITSLTSTQAEITKAATELKDDIVSTEPGEYDELEDGEDTDSDNGEYTTPAETTTGTDTDTDNRPTETEPPATQKPAETSATTQGDLPYIPDDGKGSGNLPKEDSAPTGVDFIPPLALTGISGIVLSVTAAIGIKKKNND